MRKITAPTATFLLAGLLSAQATGTGLLMDNEVARKSNLKPRVEVATDPTLVPKTGLTLEAWITYDESTLPTSSGNRYPTIIRKGLTPTTPFTYFLRVDAATSSARALKFALRTWDSTQSKSVTTTCVYAFAAGEFKSWTHLAATFDGSDLRIFVNGIEKQKAAVNGGPQIYDQSPDKLNIGTGGMRDQYETWHGGIDEVRLWPYARTAAEIKSTMNLQLSGVPGLVSTWNLDGIVPTTTIVPDTSGKNNGTQIALATANSGGQFASNTIKFTSGALGVTGFGAGTAGCSGTPAAGMSGVTTVGSSALAIVCVNANTSGTGFFAMSASPLTTPIPLIGANIWINPAQVALLVPASGNANGLVRIPITIPTGTPTNQTVYCQFFFDQPSCSVPLFASQGFSAVTQ